MKKRSFRVLFVCLLMLAVGCFAAACKEKEHVHEYIDVVTPPTCTERGYTTHTCEADGENYTDSYVDALGHDWDEGTVTKEATCTAAGEKTFTCLRCDETRTEPIEPKGHTPGEAVRENEKAATCTEAGSYDEVVYCEVCKTELSREQVTVPTIAHTAGAPVHENEKAATCTQAGSYDEVVYCEVCNTELSRTEKTIAKLEHTPGEAVRENEKAATCTEAGSYDEVVYCTVCETELSREQMTIPTIAHTAGVPVHENEKAATCTAAGSYDEVIYCTVCKEELSRTEMTVPTIAHTAGAPVRENEKAATCTEAGSYDEVVYCTMCETELSREQVTVPTIAHTEGEPVHENEKAATCTQAGSYDEVVYCTVCGTVISRTQVTVPTIAHTEGEPVHENEKAATCTEAGSYDEVVYCTVCGTVISRTQVTVPTIAHTEGEPVHENEKAATCTEAGSYDEVVYCEVCSTELSRTEKTIAKLKHTAGAPVHENEKAATCTQAGSYDEVVYCEVCGAVISRTQMTVPTIAHTAGAPVCENEKAATCTEAGSYDEVVYCEVCGTVISRTEKTIDALEHDLTYTAEVAATCEDAGTVEHWTCSNCNKYFADEDATEELTDLTIPPKGHDLTYAAEVAATCEDTGTVEHWTCSNCNKYFADEDATVELTDLTIPAKGHSWSEAWTSDGGDYHWHVCTVCNVVDEATKAAHTYIEKVDDAYLVSAATCTKKAVYSKSCSVCGAKGTETFESGELAAHTEVTDPAVAPTCTTAGKTQGSHCSVCGDVLVEQEEIAKLVHQFVGHVCSMCYAIEMVGVDGIDDGATVAVHDPSIIVAYADADGNLYPESADGRQKMYFIFGTQLAAAYSYDMESWLMFTPTFYAEKENEEDEGIVSTEYTKIFKSAAAWPGYTDSDTIKGNLWAPDIIYNEDMGQWCLYYSMSGDSSNFRSSIFMMTSDNLTGPYEFVDFVVFSGFNEGTGAGVEDYKAVTGDESVPSRYSNNKNAWNNDYGVSCIDPSVLYDKEGGLWLNYGSWSGGIFLIKLDNNTGLRDKTYNYGYNGVTYDETQTSALVYDPYLGVHIAGGWYVSGEGPYIAYMNDYYYLFLSYGFYSPEGGYNMRVFRSKTIDGKYVDMNGNWAVYNKYTFNYGDNVSSGEVLMQNYKWSWWTGPASLAQGHNSVLVDGDKAYLIYHIKYDNGTAHHNVEVHELVFGENGWPLAAPFQKSEDDQVVSVDASELAGSWSVILHTSVDYENLQVNTDKVITLTSDGKVTGAYTGTWSLDGQYITITIGGVEYKGVVMEQQIEGLEGENVAYTFTATNATANKPLWGVKNPEGQSAAESVLESLVLPGEIMASMNLPATGDFGTIITYSSDNAAVLSDTGVYTAPETDTEVILRVTVTSGTYTSTKEFTIKVLSEASANAMVEKIVPEELTIDDFIVAKAAPLAGETVNAVSQIDASTGVSLTFRVENIGSDWDVIFRAPGKKAIVYLAVLNYQNADTYELSATISEAGAKILTDHGFTADTGNYWRLFLGSLCDNEDKSCIATISYNVDGSIAFYRDGVLMLTYAATTEIGESTVGALSKYMAEQVGSVGLEVIWPVEDLIIGYAVDYKPCEHIYGAYDGDTATCTLCGATKVKVSAGDKIYEAEFVSRERAEEVTNTDTSGTWWDSAAMGAKQVSGDFAVQYTWENTRDKGWYQDIVLEFTDGTGYFDMNFFLSSGRWGNPALWTGGTCTTEVTFNGETATLPAQNNGTDTFYGDYVMTVIRLDDTLFVLQTLDLADGSGVWRVLDVFTEFPTKALTIQVTGNPYYADNLRVAVGTISEVTQTTETVEVNQRFDSPTLWTTWYEVPVSFAYGQTLTVWGTQESEMLENWDTTLWEIREGFTGRCDAYGWNFDPLNNYGNTTKFGTYSVVSTALNGQATTFGDNEWAEYRDIAKNCEYTFTFSWAAKDALTVTVQLDNGTSTYQCVYTLPIIDSTATEFNVHLTAEDVIYFTVEGYSITK